jgi:hypothetical protein
MKDVRKTDCANERWIELAQDLLPCPDIWNYIIIIFISIIIIVLKIQRQFHKVSLSPILLYPVFLSHPFYWS